MGTTQSKLGIATEARNVDSVRAYPPDSQPAEHQEYGADVDTMAVVGHVMISTIIPRIVKMIVSLCVFALLTAVSTIDDACLSSV